MICCKLLFLFKGWVQGIQDSAKIRFREQEKQEYLKVDAHKMIFTYKNLKRTAEREHHQMGLNRISKWEDMNTPRNEEGRTEQGKALEFIFT